MDSVCKWNHKLDSRLKSIFHKLEVEQNGVRFQARYTNILQGGEGHLSMCTYK